MSGDHSHGTNASHGGRPPVDHSRHAHAGHDHGAHDHGAKDHAGHDHGSGGHDHAGHDHSGSGHAGHSHAVPTSLKAFAIGASANFAFVVIEFGFGYFADSLALMADAGHNLSDVLGLLLAWAAAWLSQRTPTERRTFGYGRTSILAALANAIILLVGTGGIAVEALSRFSDPAPIQTGIVMVVALVGIGVNFGTALLFMAGRKGDLNVRGAFVHLMADAAVSLGVVIAAGVIALTGWLWLDPAVSLVIAVVIVVGTWGLLRDSVDLALDAVPRHVDRQEVEAYLGTLPGVVEVHDLHIWGLSTTDVALTAHLVRPQQVLDDAFIADICQTLKARFGIGHATLQIEAGTHPCGLASAQVV